MSLFTRFAQSLAQPTKLFSAFRHRPASSIFSDNYICLALREKHTIKTNRSVAKRFRARGDGSLKRMKSGTSHNTGYRSRGRNNRLSQSTTITDKKMEAKMKQCMGIF